MADKIDKSLTQGPRGSVTIPGDEQIQETVEEVSVEEEQGPGPIETTENEDGSVDIDFDPNAISPEGGDEHYANLAEFLPEMCYKKWDQTFLKNTWTTKWVEKIGRRLIPQV